VLYGLKQVSSELNFFSCGQISERLEADSCIFKKTVAKEVKGVMREQHNFIALNVDDLFILVHESK
jgi:hypothetical protein